MSTGDFELHPSIAGEVGYDSNWFLRSSATNTLFANSAPAAPVVGSLEFRVTPSIYLSTVQANPEKPGSDERFFGFRGGVSATYREFIGLNGSNGSAPDDISNQRNVGVSADGTLDIAKGREFGGQLTVGYGRVIQPNIITANPDQSFVYDTGSAAASIRWQPGRGTLTWNLGYTIGGTLFETSTGNPYDNWTQGGFLTGNWQFRPRTALFYELTVSHVDYTNSTQAAPVLLLSSTPVRTKLGISGLITDRFAASLAAGWGATFFSQIAAFPDEPQYDSVIGNAEIKWFLAASPGIADVTKLGLSLSSIALGYTRDFQSSYLGDFTGKDRGYLKFSYLFGGQWVIAVEGGVGAIEYPELFWSDFTERHASYTDIQADATFFAEYRFLRTVGVNLTFRYTQNFSNAELPVAEGTALTPTGSLYDMSWNRYEAFLGLRWFL